MNELTCFFVVGWRDSKHSSSIHISLFPWVHFVFKIWMRLILGMCSDGKMEVVVPSFVHYLEVLDGADGEKLPGIVELHFLSLPWLDFALHKNMSNRPK